MFTVVMVVGVLTIVDASSTSPIVVEQTKLINDFDVAGFKLAIKAQDSYEF